MAEQILVADIGGTNARFAIATREKGKISLRKKKRLRTAEYCSIDAGVGAYLNLAGVAPKAACFAIAAPVTGQDVKMTNADWAFNIAALKDAFSFSRVRIVNDFFALAAGIPYLSNDAFISIKPGVSQSHAPSIVLGPGTGFGQAIIYTTNAGQHVISTQGGHVSLAPGTKTESELMQICGEFKRTIVEDYLCGRGMIAIYTRLCEIHEVSPLYKYTNEIVAAANENACPIAVRSVNIFCGLFGQVAGDAVLATGARGGVFLAGGMSPKIKQFLMAGDFTQRFCDKGAMSSYVEPIPITLIVQDDAALYGSAAIFGR